MIHESFFTHFSGIQKSYGLVFNDLIQPNWFEYTDICLCFENIFWSTWFILTFMCISKGSTRVIIPGSFHATDPEIIKKFNVTILCHTSFYLIAWMKSDIIHKVDLSSVRILLIYGGYVPSSLCADIYRYFEKAIILSRYGMTEISGVSENVLDTKGNFIKGRLYPGITTKIIDEHGNRCGPNARGEICIKIEHGFLGYLDDLKTTAATVDAEGFILSGDIGHFDDRGFLHIIDRKKDIFRVCYFGYTLSPSVIEEYLIQLPEIRAVCVVGISISEDSSKLPAAVIVRDQNSNLDGRKIYDIVASE